MNALWLCCAVACFAVLASAASGHLRSQRGGTAAVAIAQQGSWAEHNGYRFRVEPNVTNGFLHWDKKTYCSFSGHSAIHVSSQSVYPWWTYAAKTPADLAVAAALRTSVKQGWSGKALTSPVEDKQGILTKALLTEAESSALLKLAMASHFGMYNDTIDKKPTVEKYVYAGMWINKEVQAVLETVLWGRILPIARRQFGAHDLRPAYILFRRYDADTDIDVPGDGVPSGKGRDFLPLHRDSNSVVTINISLQDKDAFTGGVFISDETTGESPTRMVPMDRGDVFMHNATTLHGVEVTKGTRYSLLMWTESKDKPSGDKVIAQWAKDDAAEDLAEKRKK